MTDHTQRLALPLLDSGQAQKEIYHNEALTLIDALLHGCIEGSEIDTPPPSPFAGQSWLIGADPDGAWAGHAGAFACWTEGGWRFVAAREGMAFQERETGVFCRFDGTAWERGVIRGVSLEIEGNQVVGPQLAAILNPAGGSISDGEARTAITAILGALREHGLIAA